MLSITNSHIWHVDTSKCVNWLDTHSMKVRWWYVQLNANAAHFCDTFFIHRAVLSTCPKKTILKIINPATLGTIRIIYCTFSKYSRSLYKLEATHRVPTTATTDRIPELPTDRHFLDLKPFFGNQKKIIHRFTVKVNQIQSLNGHISFSIFYTVKLFQSDVRKWRIFFMHVYVQLNKLA